MTTKKAAEKALAQLDEWAMDGALNHEACGHMSYSETAKWVDELVTTIREFIAQRPDEETVRKGRVALLSLAAWARARSDWSHQRNAVHDEEAAVLAAMYQPEEG